MAMNSTNANGRPRLLPPHGAGATMGFLQRHQRFPFERTVSSPEFYSSMLQRQRQHQLGQARQLPPMGALEHGEFWHKHLHSF